MLLYRGRMMDFLDMSYLHLLLMVDFLLCRGMKLLLMDRLMG